MNVTDRHAAEGVTEQFVLCKVHWAYCQFHIYNREAFSLPNRPVSSLLSLPPPKQKVKGSILEGDTIIFIDGLYLFVLKTYP